MTLLSNDSKYFYWRKFYAKISKKLFIYSSNHLFESAPIQVSCLFKAILISLDFSLTNSSISYLNLQLFEILFIRSDFSFPWTKKPFSYSKFSENFNYHCLKILQTNRNSYFIYLKKNRIYNNL